MFCWRCGHRLAVDPPARGIWWCFDCGARYMEISTRGAPALVQYGAPRTEPMLPDGWHAEQALMQLKLNERKLGWSVRHPMRERIAVDPLRPQSGTRERFAELVSHPDPKS